MPELDKGTIGYRIIGAKVHADGREVDVGRVDWGVADPRGANELVRAADAAERAVEDAPSAEDVAADVIRDLLREGPATAERMDEARAGLGIGRHAWEKGRASLRRDGLIESFQPGKRAGKGGRGPRPRLPLGAQQGGWGS